MKKIVLFLLCSILLTQIVLAQRTEEYLESLLIAIFGKLPPPCEITLVDPNCIRCMMYVKMFPFIFYTSLLFLVFYAVISQMVPAPRAPRTLTEALAMAGQRLARPYNKVAALLAIVLGLFFLHVEAAPALTVWTAVALGVFSFLFTRGVLGLTHPYVVFFAISIFMWLILTVIVGIFVSPTLMELQRVCLR